MVTTLLKPAGRSGKQPHGRGIGRRSTARLVTAALFCVTGLAPVVSAGAQDFQQNEPTDTAGNRPQPDYDAIGLLAGNFRIYPTLSISGTYDDNVYAREVDRESDYSASFVPSLAVRWSRPGQQISLNGDIRVRRYESLSGQNDEQYRLDSSASFELSDSAQIAANAGWTRSTVDRGTFENGIQVGQPLQQERLSGQVSGRKRFNRLFLTARVSGEQFRFDDVELEDGEIIDQQFRNGHRFGGRLGGGYEIGPRLSLVVNGTLDRYEYKNREGDIERDATGYVVTAGIRYELSELIVAEVGAGHRNHDFDDPTVPDISGFAPSATLRWYPTPLLSIRFDLTHSTTTSAFDNIAAVAVTSASATADYELKRNLLLTAGTDASFEDYGPEDGTSRRWSVFTRASWKANRMFRLSGTLSYERRSSSAVSLVPEFDALRFFLTTSIAR